MEAVWLAIYILIWPVFCIGVLAVIWVAVVREIRAAKSGDDDVV